nr:leucine-rich repeat-containing G-protein coupled receptor 5-like [Aedes albopictus]
MEMLNLNGLKITAIEENAFENAGKLKELFLEDNRLQTFPVNVLYGARYLKKLILTANNITNIAYSFESNNLLHELFIDKNKINQLPSFENIPQLKTFNGTNNALDHIERNQFIRQTQLEDIDLSYNQLTNLTLQLSSNVIYTVDISNNKLESLNINLRMDHLNIENNVLSTFGINGECTLKSLKMANNKLTSLTNLANCRSIELLDLSENSLESFRYSDKFENLQKLNLTHNNLFEFYIPAKPKSSRKLWSLDLSHNYLSYLTSLPSFISLTELRLNNNQLLGIHLNTLPTGVQYLFVSNNQWKCADAEAIAKISKDKVKHCNEGFKLVQGICCKEYGKIFNDVLNEMIRHTYFHEQSNYDTLKNKCPQKQYNTHNTDIERIRQSASEADTQIYQAIANAKESLTEKQGKADD